MYHGLKISDNDLLCTPKRIFLFIDTVPPTFRRFHLCDVNFPKRNSRTATSLFDRRHSISFPRQQTKNILASTFFIDCIPVFRDAYWSKFNCLRSVDIEKDSLFEIKQLHAQRATVAHTNLYTTCIGIREKCIMLWDNDGTNTMNGTHRSSNNV